MEITKEDEKKFAILYERYMEKKNKEEFAFLFGIELVCFFRGVFL